MNRLLAQVSLAPHERREARDTYTDYLTEAQLQEIEEAEKELWVGITIMEDTPAVIEFFK